MSAIESRPEGRAAAGRRRGTAIPIIALAVAVLLPALARASSYGPPGINGARIDLSRDGYGSDYLSISGLTDVTGKGFKANDVVQIFQCHENSPDLHTDCLAIGTSNTDAAGNFFAADVPISPAFTSAGAAVRNAGGNPLLGCYGGEGNSQCEVVAANYDPVTRQPSAKASHYICWNSSPLCKPLPTDSDPTTTTTTTSPTTTTTSPSVPTLPATTLPSVPTTLPPAVSATTTTTTPVSLPPAPCSLREDVVNHPYGPSTDPNVGNQQTLAADDPLWRQERRLTLSPSARQGHAMAYLPPAGARSGQTVLFGGFRSGPADCVLGDTWIWDGAAWHRALGPDGLPVPGPPARYGHAMAFDGVGIVLFGGYDGFRDMADTWTWNGSEWTHSPAAGPSERSRTAMAYNAGSPVSADDDQALLFGGDEIVDGQGRPLGDTWSWDGRERKWTQRAPVASPAPRSYAQMAYRPGSGVVMHGGRYGSGTFVWDGTNWTQTNKGPPSSGGAMAYHPATGKVVLQGGSIRGTDHGYDGVWDGTGWAVTASQTNNSLTNWVDNVLDPPARNFPAMAEDALGHVVFFGGNGPLGTADDPAQAEAPLSQPPPECSAFLQAAADDPAGVDYSDPCWQYARYSGVLQPSIGPSADRGDTWTLVTPSLTNPPAPGLGEEATLELDTGEVFADGKSTVEVTTKVMVGGTGAAGYLVTLSTDGDVTFSASSGTTGPDGTFTSSLTASTTPGFETITATTTRPGRPFTTNIGTSPPRAQATLSERGMTLSLSPVAIPADGQSTSVATADVYQAGLVDEQVCFTSDSDVTFSTPGPDHCGAKTGAHTWQVTVASSDTPGLKTITASGKVSGLRATATLVVGGGAWIDRSAIASGPTPGRQNAAMAYDEAHKVTVVFGGYATDQSRQGASDPADVLGDTWTWDGSSWSQLVDTAGQPIPGPSPREGAAMAYDASGGKLVLFGGHDGTRYLGDTWAFDPAAKTWTQLFPAQAPSARYVANMAPDGTGVLLFSGTAGYAYDVDNGPADPNGPGRLHDTWTWRNGAWTEEHPERVPPRPPPADTRTTSFTNPSPIVAPLPAPPPGCPGVRCDPDTANPYPSAIDVSGLAGKVAGIRLTIRDVSWTQTGPADADIMVVAPDGKAVKVMSDACGTDPLTGPITLTFDDTAGGRLGAGGPCTTGTYRPTDIPTPECTPFHSPDYFPAPAPPGTTGTGLSDLDGTDPNGVWSLYVVDDCPDDANPLVDAGRIAGGWTLRITTTDTSVAPPSPLSVPPGRGRAALAYDPVRNKILLFGGSQEYQANCGPSLCPHNIGTAFQPLGDTWTWDVNTNTWAQQGVGTHPGARRSAVMAFHPGTGRMVLFGGASGMSGRVADPDACPSSRQCPDPATAGGAWLADTWTWDGEAWAQQASPLSPPGPYPVGLAQDPDGRLVLMSGLGASALTWTWDPRVRFSLSVDALPADGVSKSVATAFVTNSAGRGLGGLVVRFATDGDARFSVVTDHGDGTYTATVTASRTGGIETLTAHTPRGLASTSLNEVEQSVCVPGSTASPPGSWTAPGVVADMPSPRNGMAATTGQDGRIYVFGGGGGYIFWGGEGDDAVLVYNPCTNSWRRLPPMPGGARGAAAAATGPDGRIFVVGGVRPNPAVSMDLVEVYTPGRGSTPGRWDTLPMLPTPRSALAALVDARGNLYAVGGMMVTNGGNARYPQGAAVYSPVLGLWSPTAPMVQATYGVGSALVPDGRVLAGGGYNATPPFGTTTNRTEAYNPATGNWSAVAPMIASRLFFDMASGPDGVVYAPGGLVNGGDGRSFVGTSAEAYVECANVWTPAPPMHLTRAGHAVVTGPDGRIYAIGGDVTTPPTGSIGDPFAIVSGQVDPLLSTPSVEAYTVDPATTANLCPRAGVDDVTVTEQQTSALFTVTLSRPPTNPLSIDYRTDDVTATAGSDYIPTSGALHFGVGELSDTIEVAVLADGVAEGDETFKVSLSAVAAMAGVAKAEGTATIVDNTAEVVTTTTVVEPTTTTTVVATTTTSTTTTSTTLSTTTTTLARTTTTLDRTVVPTTRADRQSPPPTGGESKSPPLSIPPEVAVAFSATPGARIVVIPPAGPSQPLTQPLSQSQAQQQQAQQQVQQQVQQQAQQQAQAQTQLQVQAAMAAERQRENQVERANIDGGSGSGIHLASARRPTIPIPVPLLSWISALVATGAALMVGRGANRSPARQASTTRSSYLSPGRRRKR